MSAIQLNLGSLSKPKFQAVQDAFLKYFPEIDLRGFAIDSAVSCHPLGFEETLKGAKHRAVQAFSKRACAYAIGIEAGLIPLTGTNTGHMDLAICVIYDGSRFTYGGSPLFELPHKVVRGIVQDRREFGVIFPELWPHLPHTHDPLHKEAIRFLSKEVVKRPALLEMAVLMALVPIVSKDDFYDF